MHSPCFSKAVHDLTPRFPPPAPAAAVRPGFRSSLDKFVHATHHKRTWAFLSPFRNVFRLYRTSHGRGSRWTRGTDLTSQRLARCAVALTRRKHNAEDAVQTP